jgi:predicted phosphodiesterase
MTVRVAILSDVHGNLDALNAVQAALKKERLDHVVIAGDHVLFGPDPAGVVDALRDMEASGATIVQGNTDVAVADFDYSAANPSFNDGVPDIFRAAAEWAHDALGDERVAWLRRLPSERRLMLDDTMLLACHASPGSQTQGFDMQLDPSVVFERLSKTDARLIACGHTHLPEIRDLGWKMIINDGSAGFVYDGDPTASWALVEVTGSDVTAEIKRTEFDTMAVANAISARGLVGDVYRAATVRTGKNVR